MSLRKKAKSAIPEYIQDNINIQIYLSQHKLTDISNPSDDSDFEDTSYETDLLYETEQKNKRELKTEEQRLVNKQRERNAKLYYQKNKNISTSIFNMRGINFVYYDHNYISFIFSPSTFSTKFLCAHRKYHVSLKYEDPSWYLERFHVPNKDDVLKIFRKVFITDDILFQTLFRIYNSLVKSTIDQINYRKEKHQRFLNHEEVELNSDDEKLFLTNEERKKLIAHRRKILKRMLPPNYTSGSDEEF